MKNILCLTIFISIVMFSTLCLAEGIMGIMVKGAPKDIEGGFFDADGGKIELVKGTWRFVKDTTWEYACLCKFSIVNRTDKTYLVAVIPHLYDDKDFKLYPVKSKYDRPDPIAELPFEPILLGPGQTYDFEDKFNVSQEIALAAYRLEINIKFLEKDNQGALKP